MLNKTLSPNVRDIIEDRIDAKAEIDWLFEHCTDMQGAICILLMCGYSPAQAARHFEISPQAVHDHLKQVKKLLIRYRWRTHNGNTYE